MTDRFARLAYILALIPLSIGLFIAVMAISQRTSGDSLQLATLAGTLLICAAVTAIWRRYVRWTPGWSTYLSGTTILVVGHVLVWTSLLKAVGQCDYTPDLMRISQSLTLVGLWCGGFVLVAWGSLLRRASRSHRRWTLKGVFEMTPTAARLAIAMALFPLALGFYLGYYMVDGRLTGSVGDAVFFRAGSLTAAIIVVTWLVLWRRQVAWTRRCAILTASLAAACVASPAASLLPEGPTIFGTALTADLWEVFRYTSPLFTLALFIAGTAGIWRARSVLDMRGSNESGFEIEKRVACASCGYSLRGLREVRCPECGWSATVDELVARVCAELTEARDSAATA